MLAFKLSLYRELSLDKNWKLSVATENKENKFSAYLTKDTDLT